MRLVFYRLLSSQPIPKPYYKKINTITTWTDFHISNAYETAREVFDESSQWDVISATALIGRFIKNNRHEEAVHIFSRMFLLNVKPNQFTFGTIIHSSIVLKDLSLGKNFHACAIKMGFASNVFVGSALLNFYAKLSTVEEAESIFEDTQNPNVVCYTSLIFGYLRKNRFDDALRLFETMPEQKNVVTWNAMIAGYSKMGYNEESVNLFIIMLRKGLVPTQSTFPCVISAAANIASLGIGRGFHAVAIKFMGKLDLFVGNSLVSFYAKCGNMEESVLVFNKLEERNVVSYNAIICGFAHNGKGFEAIEFFKKMQMSNLRPSGVSFLGLLLACDHAGLVDEAYLYFNNARFDYPTVLKAEHYACMVDIFARAGRFQKAWKFLYELPFDPGIGFWKSVLGGCQIHSNVELGEFAARKILALNPGDVSSFIMLSNAYTAMGNWEAVSIMRKEMKEKGMKRTPGCSWIDIRSKVHNFVNGDIHHDQKDEIYMVLKLCIEHIKESQASIHYELLHVE